LFHPANDTVTPTEQSVEMFRRAGQPTELILIAGIDHFASAEGDTRPLDIYKGWLDTHFPV
jgi:hypothetical protein